MTLSQNQNTMTHAIEALIKYIACQCGVDNSKEAASVLAHACLPIVEGDDVYAVLLCRLKSITRMVHPDLVKTTRGKGAALLKQQAGDLFASYYNTTGPIFREIKSVVLGRQRKRDMYVGYIFETFDIIPIAIPGITIYDSVAKQRQEEDNKLRMVKIKQVTAMFKEQMTTLMADVADGPADEDCKVLVKYTHTVVVDALNQLDTMVFPDDNDVKDAYDIVMSAMEHMQLEIEQPKSQKRQRDTEDDDIAHTKRRRTSSATTVSTASTSSTKSSGRSGKGLPIVQYADMDETLPQWLNLVVYWMLELKPENPSRKCTAGHKISVRYINTIAKVLQRQFPAGITLESILAMDIETILTDTVMWNKSKKTDSSTLCAWNRFKQYLGSMEPSTVETLLVSLPMTNRRVQDYRFVGWDMELDNILEIFD